METLIGARRGIVVEIERWSLADALEVATLRKHYISISLFCFPASLSNELLFNV